MESSIPSIQTDGETTNSQVFQNSEEPTDDLPLSQLEIHDVQHKSQVKRVNCTRSTGTFRNSIGMWQKPLEANFMPITQVKCVTQVWDLPRRCSIFTAALHIRLLTRLTTFTAYGTEQLSATSSTWMISSWMPGVNKTSIYWSTSLGCTALILDFHSHRRSVVRW